MKILSNLVCTLLILASFPNANAAVIPSAEIIQQQQGLYNTQQILALMDTEQVKQKLISLGVNPEAAKIRVASMTDQERMAFNSQLNDMPAGGGVAGTIITILLVIAVLDLLGVTDVYPFIRPVN